MVIFVDLSGGHLNLEEILDFDPRTGGSKIQAEASSVPLVWAWAIHPVPMGVNSFRARKATWRTQKRAMLFTTRKSFHRAKIRFALWKFTIFKPRKGPACAFPHVSISCSGCSLSEELNSIVTKGPCPRKRITGALANRKRNNSTRSGNSLNLASTSAGTPSLAAFWPRLIHSSWSSIWKIFPVS